MADLAERLAALQLAVLRCHPELSLDGRAAQHALQARAAADLVAAEEVRTLDAGARAAVVLFRTTRFQENEQRCRVEVALGDAEAAAWAEEQLRDLRERFDVSLELTLDVTHEAMLPALRACGLTPRMTWLHGHPETALDGLRAGPLDRECLSDDLRIEALRHPRHVEPIVTMLRAYYEAEPETGFISPHVAVTPAHQARLDAFLRDSLNDALGKDTAQVVLRDDDVLGYGMFIPRRDPIYGRSGGMAIGFAKAIHGRGLSKLVYERLLESMLRQGIELMRGRTANPAVLHLAKRMRRPVRGWQLEPGPLPVRR